VLQVVDEPLVVELTPPISDEPAVFFGPDGVVKSKIIVVRRDHLLRFGGLCQSDHWMSSVARGDWLYWSMCCAWMYECVAHMS